MKTLINMVKEIPCISWKLNVSQFSGDDTMLISNLSPTFRSKLLPQYSKEAKNSNLLGKFVAFYREVPACPSMASLVTEEARSAETLIRNYEST
jgi:hypothetical protein